MKYVKISLFTILIFALFILKPYAYSATETNVEIDTESIYNSIPDDIEQTLPDDFFDKEDIVKSANNVGFEEIFGYIINCIKSAIKPTVNLFINLVCALMIISLINASKNTLSNVSFGKTINFITTITLTLIVYNIIENSAGNVINFLSTINVLINAMIPVMTLIYTLGGNTATAVISSSGLSITVTIINFIIQNVINPIIQICFGLTFADKIGSLDGLSSINKTLKSIVVFLLTASTTFFSIFLVFKTNLSSASDGVAARTIKFAGSFVPIIGGPLGESIRTLMSGISLIKSSTGVVGIIIVILITIPTLLKVLLTKFTFEISSNIAFLLGCKKEGEFLKETSSLFNLLLAVIFSVTVLFVFELIIFVSISPSLGKT